MLARMRIQFLLVFAACGGSQAAAPAAAPTAPAPPKAAEKAPPPQPSVWEPAVGDWSEW